MLDASLYIAFCSARNRIRVRLRRLREPRYLIGALLATAYLLFVFVAPRRVGRRGGRAAALAAAAPLERLGWSLGGAGLLLMSGVAWMFPSASHLLTFTEAEIAFLFPAPVSRRQLLVHRLIRAQLGLLVAAMIPAFFVTPAGTGSVSDRLLLGVALWAAFTTTRVYFAGVTMAREHLGSSDMRVRRMAWAPLLATAAAVLVIGVPAARALAVPAESIPEALVRIDQAMSAAGPRVVLWPFQALLRPMFADGPGAYLAAMGQSVLVLFVTVAWVLKSDEVFAGEHADRDALRPAARPRGSRAPRLRGAGWSLPLTGRTETVFFWKNGMNTLRGTNLTSLVPVAILIVYAVVGARLGFSRSLGPAISLAALMVTAFATLLGPGSVMNDLRGDLRHVELLKTWPVSGGAVLRGEMLWPATVVTVAAWIALTCAFALSAAAFPQLTLAWRASLYGAAVVLVPALVFAQYTIHQAAAVLFPAWIPPEAGTRGFESMTQRLVLFAAVALALAVMLAPGAIAGGIVGLAFYRLIGVPAVVVPAALACLAVVAVEVLVATEALGPAYDRLDLSGVERAE